MLETLKKLDQKLVAINLIKTTDVRLAIEEPRLGPGNIRV